LNFSSVVMNNFIQLSLFLLVQFLLNYNKLLNLLLSIIFLQVVWFPYQFDKLNGVGFCRYPSK